MSYFISAIISSMAEREPEVLRVAETPLSASTMQKFFANAERLAGTCGYVTEKFRVEQENKRLTAVVHRENEMSSKSVITIFRLREDSPVPYPERGTYKYPYKQVAAIQNQEGTRFEFETGDEILTHLCLGSPAPTSGVDYNLRVGVNTDAHSFRRRKASNEEVMKMISVLDEIDPASRLNRFGKTISEVQEEEDEKNNIRIKAEYLLKVVGGSSVLHKKGKSAMLTNPDTLEAIRIEAYKEQPGQKNTKISIEFAPGTENESGFSAAETIIYILDGDNNLRYFDALKESAKNESRSEDEREKDVRETYLFSKLSYHQMLSAELLNPGRLTDHTAVIDMERKLVSQRLDALWGEMDSYPIYQDSFKKRKYFG